MKPIISIICPIYNYPEEPIRKGFYSSKYKIEFIFPDWRQGLAKSYNEGIKIAKGNYILFWQADCMPEENYIDKMMNHFKKDDEFVIPLVLLSKPLWNDFGFVVKIITKKQLLPVRTFFTTKGGIVLKKALENYGVFDEENFKYSGETHDLTIRLKRMGVRPKQVDVKVVHNHKYTFANYLKLEYIRGYGNGFCFKKHGITRHLSKHLIKAFFFIDMPYCLGFWLGIFNLPSIFPQEYSKW